MKRTLLWLAFAVLCATTLCAQEKFTISGYVEDLDTGEKLIAANVFDALSDAGVITNNYGFFSLTLPKDSVVLMATYVGYNAQEFPLYLDQNIQLNIKLGSSVELEVVEISAKKLQRIEEETQMSQTEVPIETIKKMPALLGEVDVLKVLQLLPGVQSGSEGFSGLYVRGGSPDQNLVLLDGVPVYNVSHLLGIFSVFNADAIKNVTLTKGGFPARFGGRLSSVLEINMKDGNMKEWHGEGSIGIISSKATVEGPILRDKTSVLFSARRTYADLIAKPLVNAAEAEGEDLNLGLYFYDLNGKVNHIFNDKHRLYFSMYAGQDRFSTEYAFDNESTTAATDWGNVILAARWNYMITPKLFANTTINYSKYNIDILAGFELEEAGQQETFSAKYFSGIRDYTAKVDFDFIPAPAHYLRFGTSVIQHSYRPGALAVKITGVENPQDTTLGNGNISSLEYGVYVEDEVRYGNFSANVGIHASAFDVENAFYTSVQPRLGMRYLLPNSIALKGSYAKMAQFINLLTNEALSLPSDLWVPSTDRVKPQESWQVALGAAKTFNEKYEISIEGFYKEMSGVVSYLPGESFLTGVGDNWQDKITQGNGDSYGLEFFVQKKTGRTTGWIGYTLSWNNRQFDDVNGGLPFPYRYDRRHDISVVVSHELNERISLTGAWVYGTGNAVTLPVSRIPVDQTVFLLDRFNSEVENPGERNAFRMTNYHRLDLGVSITKKREKWQSSWNFGVYNAYWSQNPYFILREDDFEFDPNTGQFTSTTQFKEFSLLPILPSASWSFKF